MKKIVMVALLPCNVVETFKHDILVVCPEAKCYHALTCGIRCRQEAIAVELPGNSSEQVNNFNLLASAYQVEFPQVQSSKKGLGDRVCTFKTQPRQYGGGDSLLIMWERCQKALSKLSPEDRNQLSFAVYMDETERTVNFQACYSSENDFQAWQLAISNFCLAFMADSCGQLKVSFDNCKLHKSRR